MTATTKNDLIQHKNHDLRISEYPKDNATIECKTCSVVLHEVNP